MKRNKRIIKRKEQGITLIALVITIIVLLILAGVSIAMLTGENGILSQAQRAKEETEKAQKEEQNILDSYEDYMNGTTGGQWNEEKGVNSPKIVQGMTEVSFILPNGESKGEVAKKGEEGFDENNWYDYKTCKWANTVTEDGSYWVWIPRYAYKIEYNNPSDKSQGGTIDVKFLIGTTDQYYDDEGNIQTAKRAKSKEEVVDTTSDYYVHPAFTDESNIDYANGGWDKEIPGIWVAKFEAGFASGNNNAQVKASNINYIASIVYAPEVEAGGNYESVKARNWLDGEYGTITTIKYPTFQPITYSMNYISIGDMYNISAALTDSGNIYGLSSASTDSHLMKDSEWGAVAYLAWSKYGANEQESYVNNINANNNIKSVYAVTGLTTGIINDGEKIITEKDINDIKVRSEDIATNGIYAWDQTEGQKSSSTLNMYGVYDLNGGLIENTSGYVANGYSYLRQYGSNIAYENNKLKTESTKYTMVYPYNSNIDTGTGDIDVKTVSLANYLLNTKIFGDGIREISTNSETMLISWWNSNNSFPGGQYPFSQKGGRWDKNGFFGFGYTNGLGDYRIGFRPILIAL